MDHHAFVHEPQPNLLSLLADDRLGGREALAIQRVAVRAVIQHHHVVDVARSMSAVAAFRLDNKCAQQSKPDLLRRVMMRVIHV